MFGLVRSKFEVIRPFGFSRFLKLSEVQSSQVKKIFPHTSWVELGRDGSSWVKLGRVGSSWDELTRVGSSWDELGQVWTNFKKSKKSKSKNW